MLQQSVLEEELGRPMCTGALHGPASDGDTRLCVRQTNPTGFAYLFLLNAALGIHSGVVSLWPARHELFFDKHCKSSVSVQIKPIETSHLYRSIRIAYDIDFIRASTVLNLHRKAVMIMYNYTVKALHGPN